MGRSPYPLVLGRRPWASLQEAVGVTHPWHSPWQPGGRVSAAFSWRLPLGRLDKLQGQAGGRVGCPFCCALDQVPSLIQPSRMGSLRRRRVMASCGPTCPTSGSRPSSRVSPPTPSLRTARPLPRPQLPYCQLGVDALQLWPPHPHRGGRTRGDCPTSLGLTRPPLQLCRRPVPGSLTTTSRPGSEVCGGSGCRPLPGAQPAEPSGSHSEPAGAEGTALVAAGPCPTPSAGADLADSPVRPPFTPSSGKPRPGQAQHPAPRRQSQSMYTSDPWEPIKCVSTGLAPAALYQPPISPAPALPPEPGQPPRAAGPRWPTVPGVEGQQWPETRRGGCVGRWQERLDCQPAGTKGRHLRQSPLAAGRAEPLHAQPGAGLGNLHSPGLPPTPIPRTLGKEAGSGFGQAEQAHRWI